MFQCSKTLTGGQWHLERHMKLNKECQKKKEEATEEVGEVFPSLLIKKNFKNKKRQTHSSSSIVHAMIQLSSMVKSQCRIDNDVMRYFSGVKIKFNNTTKILKKITFSIYLLSRKNKIEKSFKVEI